MEIYFLLVALLLLVGSIFLQGLRKIPANPPHKGQKTFLGKRIEGKFYNEGWGFFLGFPYIVGFVLVKVERINLMIVSEKTRTPDRAESKIPIFITIRPIQELLMNYLNSGGEEGVTQQIRGKILERVREWGMGSEEGPTSWVELNQSHLEAVSVLVKQIAGDTLTEIPKYAQEVPTWIWLRYYAQPRPTKLLKNEEVWGENDWQRIKEVLSMIEFNHGQEAIEELEKAVYGRRKDIEALRTGGGKVVLHDLGVILERLNLGDIDVLGEVGKHAEGEAKEEQERQTEELELKFVRERIAELLLPPFNYSPAKALDIVQTERGKVVRTIDDKQITFDATTAKIVARIFSGGKNDRKN